MLNFSEWDKKYYSIDESAEETVLNWLSRTFGGKVKKIDSILADLTFLEKEYATQWEKDHSLIYNLKGQIETGELSPVNVRIVPVVKHNGKVIAIVIAILALSI